MQIYTHTHTHTHSHTYIHTIRTVQSTTRNCRNRSKKENKQATLCPPPFHSKNIVDIRIRGLLHLNSSNSRRHTLLLGASPALSLIGRLLGVLASGNCDGDSGESTNKRCKKLPFDINPVKSVLTPSSL